MPLRDFDPLVAEWFAGRFERPTEPQQAGWPEIRAGRDVLLSAPTGSGKTLAAFLICLDRLVRQARGGELAERTSVVYVSPLKALSNDIRENLAKPLAEITELAERRGVRLAEIRAAVRTGDTKAWERQRMVKRPPHILVTTPESLFILLTAKRGRETLRSARTVIVDEIHAAAGDKRGAHLALSLERLESLAGAGMLQRIGLSATVKPIEQVAAFLSRRFESGGGRILQFGHRRELDLAVETPRDELGPVASHEIWDETHDRLAELIRGHRTTLVFVNTRRLAERVTHSLEERLGEDAVLAHHGSLARKLRFDAEQRLKQGRLKAVVATASLELGIDVGTVDLVCQIGSPRAIAVALQRVGRSGHWIGATPKGRFFATTRDEAIELAAMVRAIRRGDLDRLEIPEAPLDILAQQLTAELAAGEGEEGRGETELYEWTRRAYPYRRLSRESFDAIVAMLSEGIAAARGRNGAYLHRDRVNGRLRPRRSARMTAITSGGAIPDNAQFQVVVEPEGKVIGLLDEDFAVESMRGDVFLLGAASWKIRRVERGQVRVEDAQGAAPTIPFWRGEAPGRTRELSQAVSDLREHISRCADDEARALLTAECGLDRRGADTAIDYVRAGEGFLGALPTTRRIVAERFFDESGGMQLVIHAPFGARINRAWGLALRKRFCRSFNLELQAAATDDGLNISLTEQHSFPLETVFAFLTPQTLEHVLTQALLDAPMFGVRWRWNAQRSLAVPRFSGGKKTPPPILRMRTDDLLAAVFPDQAACAENLAGEIRIPDHPLVKETIDNCLYEAMDLDGLAEIVRGIESGKIRTTARETPEASPFSHEILNANPYAFLDPAPLEERRARAVQMRRGLAPEWLDGSAALDQAAIEETEQAVFPVVRDAEELHDALLSLIALPPREEWTAAFEQLRRERRATAVLLEAGVLWIAAERMALARAAYPGAAAVDALPAVEPPQTPPESRSGAAAEILRGWLDSLGPRKAVELERLLLLPADTIGAALAQLEAEGQILRGRFRPDLPPGETEWCNRRVLARIHRLTLGRLRREIEPVSTADYMRFLFRWQHVGLGARLHGVDGLLQAIRQLQGVEAPAAAWEAHILPARVAHYKPEMLDRLCLSGEVVWGRFSPHPAFAADGGEQGRRVRPTKAAPIALLPRESLEAWQAGAQPDVPDERLSHPAREILQALHARGASFFDDLRRRTGRLASEIEDGLWELVTAGLATADAFENLRSLMDPKRRRGEGRGRNARPRHAAGRWALLRDREPTAEDAVEEKARRLLDRWGVLFRDAIRREPLAPAWRDLLQVLRRMEARGEIRGGRFAAAFVGEQFALPEAVDLLRATRRAEEDGEAVVVHAADPLNLVGVLLSGERAGAASDRKIRFERGVAVAELRPRA